MTDDWKGEHLLRISEREKDRNRQERNALGEKIKGVLGRSQAEKDANFKLMCAGMRGK